MKTIIIFLFVLLSLHNAVSQWVSVPSGTGADLKTICMSDNLQVFAGGSGGVIVRSTSSGSGFSQLPTGLTSTINSIIFVNSTTGFACANGGSIIKTTNSGSTWFPLTSGVTDNLNSISFFDPSLGVCSGSNGTLIYTTNGGTNWIVGVNGTLSAYYGIHMVTSSTAYACGVNAISQPFVAKTTNGGANWSYASFYLNSNEGNLRDISFISETEGFAAANVWDGTGALCYTANGGTSWISMIFPYALNTIEPIGSVAYYAAGANGYILKSTNQGVSWLQQSSPVNSVLRSMDFIDPSNGFIAGDGGVILKTTNGGITALLPVNNNIPAHYSLSQNYPNPFNPSTKINFEIPASSSVAQTFLSVYDIMGREVTTLVNQQLSPGIYSVDWNASNYPSGIYFCRLNSGDFSAVNKMILVK